jgi:hypothetical protein
MTMSRNMSRQTFLKRAGLGTVAVSFPAALGASAAFAGKLSPNGHRTGEFVAQSQASAPALGLTQPRIVMNGAVTFDPDAGWVKGGGGYELFDNARPVPKPLVITGQWRALTFVSYDTKGLASYGLIQPGILQLTGDFENLGSGLTLTVVCNVGAPGLMTGEQEGFKLEGTPYGDFHQLSPAVGITHLSVEGISVTA